MERNFLIWLAKITLSGYYNEHNKNTGNNEDYTEDEVEALVETTELWIANDKPKATEREVIDFMYENRRI